MIKLILALVLILTPVSSAQAEIWYDKLPASGESAPQPFGGNQGAMQPSFDSINASPEQQAEAQEGQQEEEGQPTEHGTGMSESSSSNAWLVILFIIVVIAVVGVWLWRKRKKTKQ